MRIEKDKIKGIMLGSIIGDALGNPVTGMSKGHILSTFKEINSYVDPAPGLKGKMERWKKPGIYSSITQWMIIVSFFLFSGERKKEKSFFEFFKGIKNAGNPERIFRHSGPMEINFLNHFSEDSQGGNNFEWPAVELALIAVPFSFSDRSLHETLSFLLAFNRDVFSITGALIFTACLKKSVPAHGIIVAAIEEAEQLIEKIKKNQGSLFDAGINPDYILCGIKDYIAVFSGTPEVATKEDAGKVICSHVNKKIKTPVKRATVNHPLAVIPYSFFLIHAYQETDVSPIFHAVNEGGTASLLCAVTGAMCGGMYGAASIPDSLINTLVNRKKVLSAIDSISAGRGLSIQEFLKDEASLTLKEEEERNAKLRHVKSKKKQTKVKPKKDLATIVVESWTKTDQAKWRKKQRECIDKSCV